MATKQEVKKHLQEALIEIGEIKPWYDKDVSCWMFSHPLYPAIEYGGDTPEEVIQNYPIYLHDFIEERLNDNLAPVIENQTKGRGGRRAGAGRPKSVTEETTRVIRVPERIAVVATWLKNHPAAVDEFYRVMEKYA